MTWVQEEDGEWCECDHCGDEVLGERAQQMGREHYCSDECERAEGHG